MKREKVFDVTFPGDEFPGDKEDVDFEVFDVTVHRHPEGAMIFVEDTKDGYGGYRLIREIKDIKFAPEYLEENSIILSRGTLRDADLWEKYTGFINFYPILAEHIEIPPMNDGETEMKKEYFEDIENKLNMNEWWPDTLNSLCPDGWYCGGNEVDGACFGFWESDPWERYEGFEGDGE